MRNVSYSKIRLLVAFLFGTGVATVQPANRLMASAAGGPETSIQSAQKATLKPAAATSPDIPFHDPEFLSEERLLELANQSRRQAGVPPLTLDPGLSHAALIHAQAMVDARELSHQFNGEPSLPQRLADATALQLDQEGENIAFDYDADHGHDHLMHSPPHRANLLNPVYNVVGMGIIRNGDRLFIVQDFGHALPTYSLAEVKDRTAEAVADERHRLRQRDLPRQDLASLDEAACSMAQADKMGTAAVHSLAEHSTVLTYTSLHPETLPAQASHALSSRNLRSFSIGTCYKRTETYPTGVYWMVLSLN
jgi:uncharacterized protein YkwD